MVQLSLAICEAKPISHNASAIPEEEGEIARSRRFEVFSITQKILHKLLLELVLPLATLFRFHTLLTIVGWPSLAIDSKAKVFAEAE
jgi:hypothetical protein